MTTYSGFVRRRRSLQKAPSSAKTTGRRVPVGIALLAAAAVIALPGAAQAAAVPVVSSDTLTVTGDGAADRLNLIGFTHS